MENQSPSNIVSSAISRRSDAPDDRDREIAKLKERLGFYESFDQIIQENVARAGDLLRHAVSVREGADEAVTNATKDLEQRRLSERQEQRALLSGLLDDVTTMQVHVERLARKVADALDDIEATLPAGPDLDAITGGDAEPIAALVAPLDADQSTLALDPTPEEIAPEDLSVIAARLAAEHGPLEKETAAVASEVVSLEPEEPSAFESFEVETEDVVDTEESNPEAPTYDVESVTEQSAIVQAEVLQVTDEAEAGVADLPVAEDSVFGSDLTSEFVAHAHGDMPDVETNLSGDHVPSEETENSREAAEADLATEPSFVEAFPIDDSLPELEFAADTIETASSASIEDYLREHESGLAEEDATDAESAATESQGPVDPVGDKAEVSDELTSEGSSDSAPEVEPVAAEESPETFPNSAFDETGYLTTLPETVRSLSTDELFLAADVEPASILPSSINELAPLESTVSDEVVEETPAALVEAGVELAADADEEISGDSAEFASDLAEEVEHGTSGDAEASPEDDAAPSEIESAETDFGDADTVIQAVESSTYLSAVPAALAEDPDIDSALSESLAHLDSSSQAPEIEAAPADSAIPSSVAEEPEAVVNELPPPAPDSRPFPAGGLGTAPRPSTAELRSAALSRFTLPSTSTSIRGIGTVVLVHGVPRATTALSLKRYLESLSHVSSVEPREYAEGILRLHVTAERSIHIDDLRGWSDGAGFEPVHLRDDLVEVRLPH